MPKSSGGPRKFAARYFLGALLLWTILVAAYAAWAFVVPHSFVFGPEIGPAASFILFVASYSVSYAILVVAVFFLVAFLSRLDSGNNGA